MQLNQTFSIALLSAMLISCGGSDGDGVLASSDSNAVSSNVNTTEITDDVSTITTDTSGVDLADVTSVSSYFTYIGSSQDFIAIQGTGGEGRSEAAVLTFQLLDRDGEPVVSEDVTFNYKLPYGSSIEPISATTDDSGYVFTTISAGKVSGLATIEVVLDSDSSVSIQSDSLSISTGLPDQDSFSISVTDFTPSGADHDGEIVGVTVRLADHWNNTVPDGTTVFFHTTGGKIQQSGSPVGYCTTSQGQCSMEWESSNPRPDDGTAVITAWALGEESFTDKDNDGWFSDGDLYTPNESLYFNLQNDLSEVFFDYNHNNEYDADVEGEEFVAFDTETNPDDQAFTEADGIYTGALCSDEQLSKELCSQSLVHVRMNATLGMTSDTVSCDLYTDYSLSSESKVTNETLSVESAAATLSVVVQDIKGISPPTGTTIEIETVNGKLTGTTSYTTSSNSSLSPFVKQFTLDKDEESSDGLLTVTLVTPGNSDEFTCNMTIRD